MPHSLLRFPVALLAAVALQFGTGIASAQPTPDALPLDLTRFFHTTFFAPKYKGPGEAIPKGVQKFGGVPFQIVGQAGFYGQTLAERGQVWQPEAIGIVVGQPFAELHLLHHAFWPDTEGQEIATIRLNYADGSKQSLPIRYGHHVRDWFRLPSEPRETMADPNTVICWRGTHPTAERLKATLRLFKSTLANPFPGKVVTTMDVVSTRQQSSYSLMAATVSGKDPGRAPARTVPPLEPEPDFTGAVKITVLDADTGKPIAGAKIDPSMDVDGAGVVGTPVITSATGEQVLQYRAGKTLSLYVTASADGYTKRAASWRTGEIPETFTFQLKAGENLGGWVRDEAGAPVSGARISVNGPGDDSRYVSASAGSAPDGSWRLTGAKGARQMSIDVSHPAFPAARFTTGTGSPSLPAQAVSTLELQNGTAVLTLRRGLTLTGRVEDESGVAITNATLRFARDRNDYNPAVAKTDLEGGFEFKNLLPGEGTLTTQAPSHSPDTRAVTVEATTAPLVITLGQGNTIRGLVVDAAGNAVEGAQVALATYYSPVNSLQWQAKTDAEGKFNWGAAPPGEVRLDISKKDYRSLRGVQVTPSTETRKFVLLASLRVTGTVVDAQSGKPLKKFKVTSGYEEPAFPPGTATNRPPTLRWQRQTAKAFTDGKFELSFADPPVFGSTREYATVLLVEADGYAPNASTAIKPEDGPVAFAFQLTRAAGLPGTLVTPEGKPVSNAPVQIVTTGDSSAQLNQGRLTQTSSSGTALKTDGNGKFTVPPQLDEFLIVSVSESGIAQAAGASFAAQPVVTLQPWARVEGVWHRGKKRGTAGALGMGTPLTTDRSKPRFSIYFSATIGRDGRFAFDHVPPGTLQLYERVSMGPNMYQHRNLQTVEVRAGETNHVVIGTEGGIDVIGQLIRPATLDRSLSLTNGQFVLRAVTRAPVPTNLKTRAEQQKWLTDWLKTEAGQKYEQEYQQSLKEESYPVEVAADGSFSAYGLKPGYYRFTAVILRGPAKVLLTQADVAAGATERLASIATRGETGDLLSQRAVAASADHEFELKAPEKTAEDKLVDLGKVALHRTLKIGDLAPTFSTKTLEGKPLKLADFRGKFVLLDFWATWCAPCVAELPHLKAVWEAHGQDKRFAFISLSLDEEAGTPKEFAEKNHTPWTQAFVGEWSTAALPREYGVTGIPSVFLIGPDGRIIATNLRGEAIGKAVAAALTK